MKVKNYILGVLLVMFTLSATAKDGEASFTKKKNPEITEVQTTLSFYIPEEIKKVYIHVSDENKSVFQKVKIYQRGDGSIICDKRSLGKGTYYYTMYIDDEAVDTQKLIVN